MVYISSGVESGIRPHPARRLAERQMYYNTESTLYMSEGDLIETIGRIKGMIKRLRERGSQTTDLEWDLCYVQREMDIRVARAESHRRYLESRGMLPASEATPAAAS